MRLESYLPIVQFLAFAAVAPSVQVIYFDAYYVDAGLFYVNSWRIKNERPESNKLIRFTRSGCFRT